MIEAELLKRMRKMRFEYDGVVREISWLVERRSKVRPQLRRKEDWLQRHIERIKGKLKRLNPSKWGFSKDGFMVCARCGRIFKVKGCKDAFRNCCDHKTFVSCGTMEQIHDFDWEHRSPQITQYARRMGIERIFK